MADGSWHNWAGNQRAVPARVERPASTDDVVRAVRRAAGDGLRVRAVGSGHSFSPAAVTDGVLLRLDRLRGLRGLDHGTGLVTVEAGMTLRDLNALLAAAGRALTNLGDVDAQTVSGAISTSTHGTGRDSGQIAAQVHGLELVLADGSVVTCGPGDRLLDAARVSLGALGVITAVTLRTEPAFLLRAVEEPMRYDKVLDGLDELTRANEHFEFYWFPHTDSALTKRNNRTDGPAQPLPRLRGWFDDVFVSNHLFGFTCRLGRRVPAVVPRVNRLAAVLLSGREYVEASHRVFTSPRRVRFLEMEYALPRADLVPVLRELRTAVDRGGWRVSFPVEVRVTPADGAWLSTAHGRDTAYVAVHQYVGSGLDDYFAAAERIFVAAGGRPHWGKLHTRDVHQLAGLYPRMSDFIAFRDELDPERRFGSEYLSRVLGP
jgi:L-gulono-1,4-lactone dehydrogenase